MPPAGASHATSATASTESLGVLEAGQAAELAAWTRSPAPTARAPRCWTQLRASKVKNGILGSFRFDANGDITTAAIPILRITGATPPGASLPPAFQGATLDRVVQVPANLVK